MVVVVLLLLLLLLACRLLLGFFFLRFFFLYLLFDSFDERCWIVVQVRVFINKELLCADVPLRTSLCARRGEHRVPFRCAFYRRIQIGMRHINVDENFS